MIVADHLGYAGGVVHGVTTYFLEVLPALVEAGVALTVCYLREPHPAADGLRERGIAPVFLSAARMNPFVALRVAEMARRSGSNVLHAMGIKGTLMARLATRLAPARTLLHLHDLIEPGTLVGGLQRALARPTDMAVCVSAAAAPIAVKRYNVRPERVRVIHNGIRLERFERVAGDARARVRAALSIAPSTPVLLLVGRMHPIKGHRAMLEMMPEIVRRCPDVQLLLVGDGPERAGCEAVVRERGLDRHVRFLGQRRDIAELLQASDVVVVPSQSEGLSLAAIEAHAAGRPVVGFDAGGIVEVVEDGVTGRIVPAADCAAFANATATLLLDEGARATFGREAQRVAQRFSLDAHVDALLSCYREVVETGDATCQATVGRSGAQPQ
jgi:glycosyltransferase involved in cell wall biosynthesis